MNRRDFLKALIATAVGTQLPFEFEEVSAVPQELFVFGRLEAVGTEEVYRRGWVTVYRQQETLLKFVLSTKGGILRWVAPAGQEIIVSPQDLRVETSTAVEAIAVLRNVRTGSIFVKDNTGSLHQVYLGSV